MHGIAGLLLVAALGANGTPSTSPQHEQARHFLNRLNQIEVKTSANEINKLIGDLQAAWPAPRSVHSDYYRLVADLCTVLDIMDYQDPQRASLARSLASQILDSPGEKWVLYEIKLLLVLRSDRGDEPAKLRDAAWSKGRRTRVLRWLKVWDHLEQTETAFIKVLERPQLTVEPPSGSNILPGMPAEMIKDPRLRKQYEHDLQANHEKYLMLRRKEHLRLSAKAFVAPATEYLVESYAQHPHNTAELQQLLTSSAIEPSQKIAILDALKQRIAQQAPGTVPTSAANPPGRK